VADEIENALSYYEATFLREIPKLYADLERELGSHPVPASCAWASGSAATATATPTSAPQTLEYALRRQAEVALRHYLTEVHWLGGELSLSAMLAGVSPEMQALAERSPDTNAPPGRALPPRADRHLRPPGGHAQGADRRRGARHAVAPQNPYAAPRSCWPTCAPSRLAAGPPRRRWSRSACTR
jgi:phosphoenolpyruvate carboxylase